VFVDKYRYQSDKAFQMSGLDGVAEVIHFMRVTDYGKAIFQSLKRRGLEKKGIWNWVRKQENWRDYVRFAPHVHWIAYGYLTDDFYEKSGGWFLRGIGTVDVQRIEGLFYYLLTHTHALERKDKVTYRGCLAPRRLKKISERVHREDILCPECGSVMVYASLDGYGNIAHLTDHTLQRKYIVREYRITGDPPPGLGLTPPV